MDENSIKVVRVTTTEFELSDGRVYVHPIPLEYEIVINADINGSLQI